MYENRGLIELSYQVLILYDRVLTHFKKLTHLRAICRFYVIQKICQICDKLFVFKTPHFLKWSCETRRYMAATLYFL